MANCTPEWPYESDWIFSSRISRTISDGTRSPVPQACDMTRFLCNCASSSRPTEMSHNDPKPVVMP